MVKPFNELPATLKLDLCEACKLTSDEACDDSTKRRAEILYNDVARSAKQDFNCERIADYYELALEVVNEIASLNS